MNEKQKEQAEGILHRSSVDPNTFSYSVNIYVLMENSDGTADWVAEKPGLQVLKRLRDQLRK